MIVLGTALPHGAQAQGTPAAAPSAPLTLKATCEGSGPAPVLRVQIANTSGKPTSVVLGLTADKGQAHVVNSLLVIAIRPATGADEAYVYVNPKYALAEGPPWIVDLAPGATHALELPVHDFISSNTFANLDAATAGGTRVVLEGRPAGKGTKPVWTGKVETKIDACQ